MGNVAAIELHAEGELKSHYGSVWKSCCRLLTPCKAACASQDL